MPVAIPLIRGFALLPTLHWLAEEGASSRARASGSGPVVEPDHRSFSSDPIGVCGRSAPQRRTRAWAGSSMPCPFPLGQPRDRNAWKGRPWRPNPRGGAREDCRSPALLLFPRAGVVRAQIGAICRPRVLCPQVRSRDAAPAPSIRRAMIDRILSMAGDPEPRIARIEIPPHPIARRRAPSPLVRRQRRGDEVSRDHAFR